MPGVTWRDVKGIRARVVHDYQAIDVLVVRGVVSRQLPRLITSVGKALAEDEKRRRQSDTAPPNTPPPAGGPRRSGSSQ